MNGSSSSSSSSSSTCNDFDIVPTVPLKPSKKRAYRKTLPGQTCFFCEAYYNQSGTCNQSSRHRGEKRPKTPDWFWELEFPKDYTQNVEKYPMSSSSESNKYYTPPQKVYPADWEHLGKWCIEMHRRNNRHHPEYFNDPDQEMTVEDKMELTCDLLGSVKGYASHLGIALSLSQCRAIIEHQKWKHWKYALTEYLPPASTKKIPSLPDHWRKFDLKEKDILKGLYTRLKAGESERTIHDELYLKLKLSSVSYYKQYLKHHKLAVEKIWKKIPEFLTPEMEFRIDLHDKDKYDLENIIGYTSYLCF